MVFWIMWRWSFIGKTNALNETIIALGSNFGDRRGFLTAARTELQSIGTITAVSPIYESAAYGKTDQPAFLNAVVALKTPQNPLNLLLELKAIEKKMGRQPRERWGPREIDLDIIFYKQEVLRDEHLTIPHPDFHNRRFVLLPLCDIRPDWWSPVHQKTVSELLENCQDSTELTQLAKDW